MSLLDPCLPETFSSFAWTEFTSCPGWHTKHSNTIMDGCSVNYLKKAKRMPQSRRETLPESKWWQASNALVKYSILSESQIPASSSFLCTFYSNWTFNDALQTYLDASRHRTKFPYFDWLCRAALLVGLTNHFSMLLLIFLRVHIP